MDVNNKLMGIATSTKNTRTTNTTSTKTKEVKTDEVKKEDPAYALEISKDAETASTSKTNYAVDQKEVAKFIDENERKSQQLINLVNALFKKQSDTYQFASFSELSDAIKNGSVEVDQATIDQAKEDVGEGGYYSVEQTSDRLVGFAKAISGGDPNKLSEMRDAVIKGFQEAEKAWGGKLPKISQDTFEATMSKFDDWAKENGITLEPVTSYN